jgi:hypothetical protein
MSKWIYLRLKWVETISLPMNDKLSDKLYDLPMSLHPKIDPYLTISERHQLLQKFGWIKIVTSSDGKIYCHKANELQMNKVLNDWLTNASFMSDVKSEMKLSVTGESYI